jgi:hypothetical protein
MKISISNFLKLVCVFFLFFSSSSVFAADDEEKEPEVVYSQKTEIDFDALDIEGVLVKPQTSLVLDRKKAEFNPLVKLRSNWNDMIEESVEEVK